MAVAGGHVYWTTLHGMIGRANLDGSGANHNFITGANSPLGVAVKAVADATKPSCGSFVVRRNPGGHDEADVTITDAGSGIASITNFTVTNGTASIPAFSPGASSVTVTAIKATQGVTTFFEFDVTDVAGNTTHCV